MLGAADVYTRIRRGAPVTLGEIYAWQGNKGGDVGEETFARWGGSNGNGPMDLSGRRLSGASATRAVNFVPLYCPGGAAGTQVHAGVL